MPDHRIPRHHCVVPASRRVTVRCHYVRAYTHFIQLYKTLEQERFMSGNNKRVELEMNGRVIILETKQSRRIRELDKIRRKKNIRIAQELKRSGTFAF